MFGTASPRYSIGASASRRAALSNSTQLRRLAGRRSSSNARRYSSVRPLSTIPSTITKFAPRNRRLASARAAARPRMPRGAVALNEDVIDQDLAGPIGSSGQRPREVGGKTQRSFQHAEQHERLPADSRRRSARRSARPQPRSPPQRRCGVRSPRRAIHGGHSRSDARESRRARFSARSQASCESVPVRPRSSASTAASTCGNRRRARPPPPPVARARTAQTRRAASRRARRRPRSAARATARSSPGRAAAASPSASRTRVASQTQSRRSSDRPRTARLARDSMRAVSPTGRRAAGARGRCSARATAARGMPRRPSGPVPRSSASTTVSL